MADLPLLILTPLMPIASVLVLMLYCVAISFFAGTPRVL
jgi:hypothetical protein